MCRLNCMLELIRKKKHWWSYDPLKNNIIYTSFIKNKLCDFFKKINLFGNYMFSDIEIVSSTTDGNMLINCLVSLQKGKFIL